MLNSYLLARRAAAEVEAGHKNVAGLGNRTEVLVVVFHAHLSHGLLGDVILVSVLAFLAVSMNSPLSLANQ